MSAHDNAALARRIYQLFSDDKLDDALELVTEDVEAVLPPADDSAEGVVSKLEAYQSQLRLMVQGNQLGPIDLPYLMDAMRSALGLRSRWGRSVAPEDDIRINRLRSCLQAAVREGTHREVLITGSGSNFEAFLGELRDHASGFLAPIIKRLEVGLRIPRIPATQSMGRLPLNPREACHPVHGKPATQSTARLPPTPGEACHRRSAATLGGLLVICTGFSCQPGLLFAHGFSL